VDDASRFFPEGHSQNQNQKVPGGGRVPASTSREFDRGEPQPADLPEPSRQQRGDRTCVPKI
jgi:hypothetical protein